MKKYLILGLLSLKLVAFDFNEDEVKVVDNSSFTIKENSDIESLAPSRQQSDDSNNVSEKKYKSLYESTKKKPNENDSDNLNYNSDKSNEDIVSDIIEEKGTYSDFDMINYTDLRYKSNLKSFSIINTDESEFNQYMDSKKYEREDIDSFQNKAYSQEMVEFNAFLYDYKLKKPNLAENYYLKFKDFKKPSLINHKIRYADFLLRTGRVDKIKNVITRKECLSNIKISGMCFYYIGIADYIMTGNNKNYELRTAKSSIPKAREIFDIKKNKK